MQGFISSVQALQDVADAVYDFTIVYRDDTTGECSFHVKVRVFLCVWLRVCARMRELTGLAFLRGRQ